MPHEGVYICEATSSLLAKLIKRISEYVRMLCWDRHLLDSRADIDVGESDGG
jgi:hypothetical protein